MIVGLLFVFLHICQQALMAGEIKTYASEISRVYCPKDELRCLGSTHPMGNFEGVDHFMKPIIEQGYNCVVVHGLGDEWSALYPSKFFPLSKQRGYEGGTLKSIIESAHQAGVKVICYCPYIMQTSDEEYIDGTANVDKRGVDTGGISTRSSEMFASMNSPFRHLLSGALKEICAMGADGLWIDGFSMEYTSFPNGHNKYTDPIFKNETGLDPPTIEDWNSRNFRRWVQWRYERHMGNAQWLCDQVHAEYPNVSISFNTHYTTPLVSDPDSDSTYAPLSWSRWREAVPLNRFPAEIGASNHSRLDPSNVAQSVPFWTQLSSDLNPFRTDVWQPTFAERFGILYNHTWISEPMNIPGDELGFRMSALGCLTNRTQMWIEGFVQQKTPVDIDLYGRVNQAIKSREEFFGGDKIKYAGVFLSNNSRDFWGLAQARYDEDTRNTDRQFTEGYFGLISMLMMDHIPYEHVFDNTLDDATLDQFAVIIAPNAACLTDEACAALGRYVERGGRLIADYETSLYDDLGYDRKDFGLADVFGVSYIETLDKYERDPHMWVRELTPDAIRFNDGQKGFTWQTRRTLVTLHPGAEILAYETGYNTSIARAVDPAKAGKDYQFKMDPHHVPVIVRNKLGKGESIYICDYLSQGYYQAPFRTQRKILKNLILQSPCLVTVEAPVQVITRAYTQHDKKRLVVHLLNLPPMSTRLFERSQLDDLEEIVPVHDICLTLRSSKAESARVIPSGVSVNILINDNGDQQVIVPEVKEHEMVVFEMK